MVGVTYDDSSGDETPMMRAPQQPQQAGGRQRPGLLSRWKPVDDDTPYENEKPISGKKWGDVPDDKTEMSASFTSRNNDAGNQQPGALTGSTRSGMMMNEGSGVINTSKSNLTASKKQLITKDKDNAEIQELMKDNLELMFEIVMKIREDEDYARSIYKDCPRLQNLLDQHPDLRPLFEDPNLVRINFEKVYRDAGGILPGDDKELNRFQKVMKYVTKHPLFKVFKVLLFIKKIVSCVMSGGAALVKTLIKSLFWTPDPTDIAGGGASFPGGAAAAAAGGNGPDGPDSDPADQDSTTDVNGTDGGDPTSALSANKLALNKAADYMSDPQVQANMNDMLQNDPDQLDEYIQNDPELCALRDSNPLCAELMSDPETMKIMTDPDNLRALGDAPELISQDFADPNWSPPELDAPPDDFDDYYDDEDPTSGAMNGNAVDMTNGGGNDNGFELGDADHNQAGGYGHSGMRSMGADTGNATDMATDQAQQNVEEQGFEDFELDDNYNQSFASQNQGFGGQYNNMGFDNNNDMVTGGEEDQFAQDFELSNTYDNNNVGGSNYDNYMNGTDPTGDVQDDAMENFELGDTDNNAAMMYNHHGDVGDNVGEDQDGDGFDEFELGDTQMDDTAAATDNAIIEDYELGDQGDIDGGTSGLDHVDGTTPDANGMDGADAGGDAGGGGADAGGDGGGGMMGDFELGDVEAEDGGDVDVTSPDDGVQGAAGAGGGGQQEKKREAEAGPRSEAAGGIGGGNLLLAQVAAGMADVVIGQIIGTGVGELFGDAMSTNNPTMLDNALNYGDYADEAVDAAEQNADDDAAAAAKRDGGANDDDPNNKNKSRDGKSGDEQQQEGPAEPTTRFGQTLAFLKQTAAEQLLSNFVGEDFAEMIVERMNGGGEEKEKDDDGGKGNDDDDKAENDTKGKDAKEEEETKTEEKKSLSSRLFGGGKKQSPPTGEE